MKTAYVTDDQNPRIADHATLLRARARARGAIAEGMRDGEGAA